MTSPANDPNDIPIFAPNDKPDSSVAVPFCASWPGSLGAAVRPGRAARLAAVVPERTALGANIRVTTTVETAWRVVVLSFS